MSSKLSPKLDYRVYRGSDAEQVTDVLADVFPRHDPLAFAVDVTRSDFTGFVRSLLPKAAEVRLTVVACLPISGEIVGVLLTNDGAAGPPESNEKFGPIASILGELDDTYFHDRDPRPGEMLHLYLLAVSDRVAGQGVGQQLVLRAMENGVRKGYRIAFAEATNRRSQHIFRKLGFIERAQILYRDHLFQGRNVFAGIAEHGGPILMEKALVGPQLNPGRQSNQ